MSQPKNIIHLQCLFVSVVTRTGQKDAHQMVGGIDAHIGVIPNEMVLGRVSKEQVPMILS